MTWQDEFNDARRASGGWYGCIVSDGWKDLVLKTDRMLAHMDPNYKINQVKEKFGGLRYYFETEKTGVEAEIMNAITNYAENRSYHICETCGKFGELREERAWIVTLCDTCNDERNKEMKRREKNLKKMRKVSEELGEYE